MEWRPPGYGVRTAVAVAVAIPFIAVLTFGLMNISATFVAFAPSDPCSPGDPCGPGPVDLLRTGILFAVPGAVGLALVIIWWRRCAARYLAAAEELGAATVMATTAPRLAVLDVR